MSARRRCSRTKYAKYTCGRLRISGRPTYNGAFKLTHSSTTESRMAWNEPGGSQDKDPWGGRRKTSGPPDLDEMIRKLQQKFNSIFGGKGKSGSSSGGAGNASSGVLMIALAVVVAWLVYDSVHIIQPAERGVVLRFGKYVDTLQPGPSIRLPRPIEQVVRVDVDQIRSVQIGYRGEGGRDVSVLGESLMLTQDVNIVEVKLAIQYKGKSPDDYLFFDRNPDITMRDGAESAIREVVGKSKMDFILKEGRSDVAARTKDSLQTILDRYKTGLIVTSVNLQDAQAPEQVQEAFLDAIRAREDQDRLVNAAEAYANEVIPKARGEAARLVEDANAYKARVVASAEGESSRFLQILREYQKAPDATRQRLYIESTEQVLQNSSKVMVDVDKGSNMIYLPLDRLMQQHPAGDASSTPGTPARAPAASTPASESTAASRAGNRAQNRGRGEIR